MFQAWGTRSPMLYNKRPALNKMRISQPYCPIFNRMMMSASKKLKHIAVQVKYVISNPILARYKKTLDAHIRDYRSSQWFVLPVKSNTLHAL